METNSYLQLSSEQRLFIEEALKGKNILVDACIGSGKTTAVQSLCNELPSEKKVLYLTYNKLLKLDAKSKIKKKNVTVTNYHGFAFMALKKSGITAGVSDLIQTFIREEPFFGEYDVLIIDEYQDIEQELAELLQLIKNCNKDIQIIAVGDMEQKIYDKTTLDVELFMSGFLEDYVKLKFTKCFRLSADIAATLGRVWKKQIIGTNDCCKVEEMTKEDIILFLSKQKPSDILCLGARIGVMSDTLNILEEKYPDKFNKKTVYASISDNDSTGKIEPKADSAIFTTYDSSKGLERKICVVFDFTEDYWGKRISQPQQSYIILRNIFCVAASRGKNHVIFVKSDSSILSEETLSTFIEANHKFKNIQISKMFEFKHKEDIEKCFSYLKVYKLQQVDSSIINIKNADNLIDLSPCIGIYQEAVFFSNYQIDKEIEFACTFNPKFHQSYKNDIRKSSLNQKILFLTSINTNQDRYRTQVITPFVSEVQSELIKTRLRTRFSKNDNAQVRCQIDFFNKEETIKFSAIGFADVVKDDVVYELKFISELTHEHFLQCASYMVAMNLSKGILWNTKDNTLYEVEISDRKAFLDAVIKTVTKGIMDKYYGPIGSKCGLDKELVGDSPNERSEEKIIEKFAVIDTETNWNDEIMSIGVVIADSKTFQKIDSLYYIIEPEYMIGGMYSNELWFNKEDALITNRKQALKEIKKRLNAHGVYKLFAYNANFDKRHLPEYLEYEWYDIMRLAAYRQYNWAISDSADCFKTGKLKRGYGVEDLFVMLSGDKEYSESHNAILDAQDELKIIQLLGHKISEYDIARISDKSSLDIRANYDECAMHDMNEINNITKNEGTLNRRKRIFFRIFGRKKH